MADTPCLNLGAVRREGSSPSLSTMPEWWNGRHSSLRGCRPKGYVGSSPTFGTNFDGEMTEW